MQTINFSGLTYIFRNYGINETAEFYGCSKSTIYRQLDIRGYTEHSYKKKRGRPRIWMVEHREEYLASCKHNREKQTDIARLHGVTQPTIHYAAKVAGLTPWPRGKQLI